MDTRHHYAYKKQKYSGSFNTEGTKVYIPQKQYTTKYTHPKKYEDKSRYAFPKNYRVGFFLYIKPKRGISNSKKRAVKNYINYVEKKVNPQETMFKAWVSQGRSELKNNSFIFNPL